MAYNPTVWEENDLLSADRMNKIENGIAEASVPPDGLLPTGGTTGQMLTKASDNDFDAEWMDVPENITMDDVNTAIAEAVPDSIVERFNGRNGAVTPQTGDYTAAMVGAVPTSRKVNNKALTSNVTLTASDVGAIPTGDIYNIVVLTETEHTALTNKPTTTMYLIPEEE